jgi:type III secretion system YscQ/HrcQ family protein
MSASASEPTRHTKTKKLAQVAPFAEDTRAVHTAAAEPAKTTSAAAPVALSELANTWRTTLARQVPASAIAEHPDVWQSLRGTNLRQIAKMDAERLNRLLSLRLHGGWSDGAARFVWNVVDHAPIADPIYADLGSANEVSLGWRIGLSEHSTLLPWLPQTFATLSSAAKHLGLTITLSPLLASLARRFTVPTQLVALHSPIGATAENTQLPAGQVAVSILVARVDRDFQQADEAESTGGDTNSVGDIVELVIPADALDSLLAQQRGLADLATVSPVSVNLPVCVAVANFDVEAVLALKEGDVVVFEEDTARVDELPILLRAGDTGLALGNLQGEIFVEATFPLSDFHFVPEEPFMNPANAVENAIPPTSQSQSHPQPFSPLTDQAATLVDVRSVPVTLQFDIGRLALTVDELAKLAVGSVVKLPAKLGLDTVSVRVNGRTFALGEIVYIDDQLGVKLTSIGNRALK